MFETCYNSQALQLMRPERKAFSGLSTSPNKSFHFLVLHVRISVNKRRLFSNSDKSKSNQLFIIFFGPKSILDRVECLRLRREKKWKCSLWKLKKWEMVINITFKDQNYVFIGVTGKWNSHFIKLCLSLFKLFSWVTCIIFSS